MGLAKIRITVICRQDSTWWQQLSGRWEGIESTRVQ